MFSGKRRRWFGLGEGSQSVSKCVGDQFRSSVYLQRLHDSCPVDANRVRAKVQLERDVLGRLAIHYQLQYLQFPSV